MQVCQPFPWLKLIRGNREYILQSLDYANVLSPSYTINLDFYRTDSLSRRFPAKRLSIEFYRTNRTRKKETTSCSFLRTRYSALSNIRTHNEQCHWVTVVGQRSNRKRSSRFCVAKVSSRSPHNLDRKRCADNRRISDGNASNSSDRTLSPRRT